MTAALFIVLYLVIASPGYWRHRRARPWISFLYMLFGFATVIVLNRYDPIIIAWADEHFRFATGIAIAILAVTLTVTTFMRPDRFKTLARRLAFSLAAVAGGTILFRLGIETGARMVSAFVPASMEARVAAETAVTVGRANAITLAALGLLVYFGLLWWVRAAVRSGADFPARGHGALPEDANPPSLTA